MKRNKLHLSGTTNEGKLKYIAFHCPGCKHAHVIRVGEPEKTDYKGVWDWNEDWNFPTFKPSILSVNKEERCHCFVEDGNIRFLYDCTHEFAGKTVNIPAWEWIEE